MTFLYSELYFPTRYLEGNLKEHLVESRMAGSTWRTGSSRASGAGWGAGGSSGGAVGFQQGAESL